MNFQESTTYALHLVIVFVFGAIALVSFAAVAIISVNWLVVNIARKIRGRNRTQIKAATEATTSGEKTGLTRIDIHVETHESIGDSIDKLIAKLR